MKILVTGGAGFIGSHLVESLVEQGHHGIEIDDLTTGKEAYLAHLPNVYLQRRLVEDFLTAMKECQQNYLNLPLPDKQESIKATIQLLKGRRKERLN